MDPAFKHQMDSDSLYRAFAWPEDRDVLLQNTSAGHYYHVHHELKTRTEAQRHCRENHVDLATIRDQEDLETLMTLKGPMPSVSFMTPVTGGLNHYVHTGVESLQLNWSSACTCTIRSTLVKFWSDSPEGHLFNSYFTD
ncbi:hypothetical protein EYF80_058854 [Liparis tanakae]|uniref:C-type lectin domain-containing protein n=1 Tax=Liparis tanakae TaxID=230148 RepID=A0A4Z2ERJ7_9TELE|nr:hypothetical protein EYF80_058854 [Liparis tanakae]